MTVTTTETTTVDKVLEVGAITQTVTVESSVETLQTSSSTLGTTVTGAAINALPMANGNYTEEKYCREPGTYCGVIYLLSTRNAERCPSAAVTSRRPSLGEIPGRSSTW